MNRHSLISCHGAIAAVGNEARRVGGKATEEALENELGRWVSNDGVVGLAVVGGGEEFGLSALGRELFADIL